MPNGILSDFKSGVENRVVDYRFGTSQTPRMPLEWALESGSGGERNSHVYVPPSGDKTGLTDAQNIQKAIDLATEEQSVIDNTNAFFTNTTLADVLLIGNYYIAGTINLKQGVRLLGTGWMSSVIHAASKMNVPMLNVTGTTYWAALKDIQFDHHDELQTTPANTLEILPTGTPRGDSCSAFIMENVYVAFSPADGIKIAGVEARVDGCYSYRSKGCGFKIGGSDMFFSNCAAGDSGEEGFYVDGGQHHIINCKSWWSGFRPSDRTKFATKLGAIAAGIRKAGFLIKGGGHMLVNCDAQDTSGASFHISSDASILNGCVADSHTHGGFYVSGGRSNTINGHIRAVHYDRADYALKIEGPATVNNKINIDFPSMALQGVEITKDPFVVVNAPQLLTNTIELGNPSATPSKPYSSTYVLDPIFGGLSMTLTGNLSVQDPTSTTRCVPNTMVRVILTQDTNGSRTVSWGSTFAVKSPIDGGPGKTSIWALTYINNKWVETGFNSF